jgi:hypothetical protein
MILLQRLLDFLQQVFDLVGAILVLLLLVLGDEEDLDRMSRSRAV